MNHNEQYPSGVFDISLEDFDKKVIEASYHKPILVDLWAEWCSPCIVLAPVLNTLINEFEGELLLAKVEVDEDENMKLAGRYAVKGFPTVILFKDGQELARFSGAKPLSFLREFIDEHIALGQ